MHTSLLNQVIRYLILKPLLMMFSGVFIIIGGIISFKFLIWLLQQGANKVDRDYAKAQAQNQKAQ